MEETLQKIRLLDSRLFDSCLPDLQPIIIIKFHENFLINNSPVISRGQSENSSLFPDMLTVIFS